MDSIAVYRDLTTEIFAIFAENNYQEGTKIMKYTFNGRLQINETVIASGKFKTSSWINTVYPCQSGMKIFMMAGSGSNDIKDHMQ